MIDSPLLLPQSLQSLSTITRKIPADYLAGSDTLRPFYKYPIKSLDFQQIIADKSRENTDRQLLARVIREQYQGMELGEKVERNLQKLENSQSFTVTTGHQLVLFGGPLFTIYKVMSTIRLAEQLSLQHPETPVVPVFWIHTEDHDYEEINHYYQDYGQKITYPGSFHTKVGAHILEDSIRQYWPTDLPEPLNAAYQPGTSLAQATRLFFHDLFKDFGLLILDADDVRFKQKFTSVMIEEIDNHVAKAKVSETSIQLKKAGYSSQVNPREVNLFWTDEIGRDRILAEGDHFRVQGRHEKYSAKEMRHEIESHPDRFSPNVTLRPLYQEMILPNLAYFGGWGEISYWMQLKGVFEHFDVNFPAVLPRFSATVIPMDWKTQWEKLGFFPKEVRKPLPELNKKYVPNIWDSEEFDRLEKQILDRVSELTRYIESEVSTTLSRSSDALRTKNNNYLENMRKKIHRIIRNENREPFAEIEALKLQIQPDGQVQERVWSLATVATMISPKEFLDKVYQTCDPICFEHQMLEL